MLTLGGQMIPTRSADLETSLAVPRMGRIRTVLLATDLSSASDAATLQAIDLTASLGARLLIVNVIDAADRAGPAPSVHANATPRIDQTRAERQRPLLAIVDEARMQGVEAAFLLWIGEAGRSIIA